MKRAAEIRRFEVRFRELAESFLLLVEVRVPMVVDREEKKNIYIYIMLQNDASFYLFSKMKANRTRRSQTRRKVFGLKIR